MLVMGRMTGMDGKTNVSRPKGEKKKKSIPNALPSALFLVPAAALRVDGKTIAFSPKKYPTPFQVYCF